MLKITFHGNDWLFVGDELERGGPICTAAQYRLGQISHAFLTPAGDVMRCNQRIGGIGDITNRRWIPKGKEPKPTPGAIARAALRFFYGKAVTTHARST